MRDADRDGLILLTGATGYIGGRLLRSLEEQERRVRCMTRRPEHLRGRVAAATEVVRGDVLESESLQSALDGVDTAYYLVHSMGGRGGFVEEDRRAARDFGRAARDAGVRRIVYLGGLGRDDELSDHLRSRHEVGEILRSSGVPTLECRASIVIGSGSLSFEMIRSLVDRLPVMTTPKWVYSLAQPIAVEDVIAYLLEALEMELAESRVVEIGGPEQVGYVDIMREYARQRGLRRLIIPVPALTPKISSLWLGLITPLYARVGRKLIDSVRHDTVVQDERGQRLFAVQPRGVREAIERALHNEDRAFAETRWSDALSSGQGEKRGWGGVKFGTRLVDSRSVQVDCGAEAAFAPIRRIGGRTGWYYGNWLWRMRGFLDLLMGGVGLRRGRRDPERFLAGDSVDFWRVEEVEENRLLRLRAEMKLPGRAWLQFEVEEGGGATAIRQTAIFDPVGIGGLLYWYAVYPLHGLVFRGMLEGIVRAIYSEGRDR
jgi:uncharacterized protein YbjT (DUF2867 family)